MSLHYSAGSRRATVLESNQRLSQNEEHELAFRKEFKYCKHALYVERWKQRIRRAVQEKCGTKGHMIKQIMPSQP